MISNPRQISIKWSY